MAQIIARGFAVGTARLLIHQSSGVGVRDYTALAEKASRVVEDLTGLELDLPSFAIEGVDRRGWAEHNIDSYAALIERLTPPNRPGSAGMAELNAVALGGLLGSFAGKVLGQYDPAFAISSPAIWMVDENIDHFAHRAQLDADEVALWVLVHELTHRAQFHAVGWFRERLLALMTQLFTASTISPIDLLGEVFARLRGLSSSQSVDVTTLFLPERLRSVAREATTIMTVAEGHAEWVMRQVSREIIPHRDEFERTIDERRQTTGVAKIVAQLTGIASKRSQYSLGLHFFEAIAAEDGDAPRRVFASPDGLPTTNELTDPGRWVRRMSCNGNGVATHAASLAGRPSGKRGLR
ncbi:zinc-dependent metalloprotease [Ferrimicrobium acidiphilum]|uniref:zinc-dependent metalloprotease n=1 Tax=Ferrimicrobium acidiphilum TaxID=121039 RepID=UPI0023F1815A|nr:zinc-dependent metalloprotease [Ferrimicrobium acidiphilum]